MHFVNAPSRFAAVVFMLLVTNASCGEFSYPAAIQLSGGDVAWRTREVKLPLSPALADRQCGTVRFITFEKILQ